MAELKRWQTMDRIFWLLIVLILFFAWMDVKQITTFHTLNSEQAWGLYNQYTGPAIWILWFGVMAIVGLLWYFISRDKSEALALAAGGWIMLMAGLEDVFFFIFYQQPMTQCMEWFKFPQNIVSKFLGETCVSPFSLILNAGLGVLLSYNVYKYLKVQKW